MAYKMAQNIDLLPKCPICSVSLYCIGIQTVRLQCGHLFCQLCVNKLKNGSNYTCKFDGVKSDLDNWLEATEYWKQYLDAYPDPQRLERELDAALQYNKSVLPCGRAACRSDCSYIHNRQVWKATDCPLGYQCPNANRCIFSHPSEAPTLPMLQNPQMSVPVGMHQPHVMANPPAQQENPNYSEITTPPAPTYQPYKPISHDQQWQCRNCGQMNVDSTCIRCGGLR